MYGVRVQMKGLKSIQSSTENANILHRDPNQYLNIIILEKQVNISTYFYSDLCTGA